jgi:hypothetical protein
MAKVRLRRMTTSATDLQLFTPALLAALKQLR